VYGFGKQGASDTLAAESGKHGDVVDVQQLAGNERRKALDAVCQAVSVFRCWFLPGRLADGMNFLGFEPFLDGTEGRTAGAPLPRNVVSGFQNDDKPFKRGFQILRL